MIIVTIIILSLVICVLLYLLKVNILKQEALEELNQQLFESTKILYDDLIDVELKLHEIDIRGAFEANDSVGFVFKEIKRMIMTLNQQQNDK